MARLCSSPSTYHLFCSVAFHSFSTISGPQEEPPSLMVTQYSIPVLRRSPGRRNGNPLQYACLGNLMDRRAWRATGHGVVKNQTRFTDWTPPVPGLTTCQVLLQVLYLLELMLSFQQPEVSTSIDFMTLKHRGLTWLAPGLTVSWVVGPLLLGHAENHCMHCLSQEAVLSWPFYEDAKYRKAVPWRQGHSCKVERTSQEAV